MTLVMRVLLLLSLGWGIGSPLFIVLGQEIPANVKIPSPRATGRAMIHLLGRNSGS
jgi:hypothetical protein